MGPASSSVLIQGPYLVRNATLSKDGHTLSILGDTNATTTLNVFGPKSIEIIKWNGETLLWKKSATGAFSGTIGFKYAKLSTTPLPSLTDAEWSCHDTFPEKETRVDLSATISIVQT